MMCTSMKPRIPLHKGFQKLYYVVDAYLNLCTQHCKVCKTGPRNVIRYEGTMYPRNARMEYRWNPYLMKNKHEALFKVFQFRDFSFAKKRAHKHCLPLASQRLNPGRHASKLCLVGRTEDFSLKWCYPGREQYTFVLQNFRMKWSQVKFWRNDVTFHCWSMVILSCNGSIPTG